MAVDPKTLTPGMSIAHASGRVHTLQRRKDDDSGWLLEDGSGVADWLWAAGDWTVVVHPDSGLTIRDVLDLIGSKLDRLTGAVTTHTERLEQLMTNQATLDADLQALGSAVGQLVSAYESASAKATAAGVDLSSEDATVKQLQAQITSALAPPASSPPAASSAPATAETGSTAPAGAPTAPAATDPPAAASPASQTDSTASSAPAAAEPAQPAPAAESGAPTPSSTETAATAEAPAQTASLPAGSVPGATAQSA